MEPEKTTQTEQWACQYVNWRNNDKVNTLGNYDAEFDMTDIMRSLREQGYDPYPIRRVITVNYGSWERVDELD